MVTQRELRKIARARLADAEALFRARRYDGALYLCGYAVEIALKARICKTLKCSGFPSTQKEFQNYASFRTHDLDVLLTLSGVEAKVKTKFLADWSEVAMWESTARYKPVGTAKKNDLALMLGSTKKLLRIL